MRNDRVLAAIALSACLAASARGEITWNWNYLNASEFPDDAKKAMTEVGKTLASWFNTTNDVTVTVDMKAFFKAGGSLGSAVSPAASTAQGFQQTAMMKLVLTGVDANGGEAEGFVNFNFTPGYRWAYGDKVPRTKMDFKSTMLHELLHCMGFAGDINPETATNGTTSWSVFDGFVTDANGSRLIHPAGSGQDSFKFNESLIAALTGNPGMYFDGEAANRANGGSRVALYSPSQWSAGSSGSHSDTRFAPSLMQYDGGSGGLESRTMHAVESGIMQDIGYSLNSVADFSAPSKQVEEASGVPRAARRCTATNMVPIVVVRHGDASRAGSVDYRTVASIGKGEATEGVDYLAAGGTLNFAAGVATGVFEVAVLSGTNEEATVEAVHIVLFNPRGGFVLGALTNFTLDIVDEDGGVRQTVLSEDFDSGALPAGWSVTAANGNPGWAFDNPAGRSNLTGGARGFAIADSAHAGAVVMETELRTPAMDLSSFDFAKLLFNLDYNYASGKDDFLSVEVGTNGPNGDWEPVWDAPDLRYPMPTYRTEADLTNAVIKPIRSGCFRGPREVAVDLSDYAGCSNVMVRFMYCEANDAGWVQIDDVRVLGNIDYEVAHQDTDGNGLPDWWQALYFPGAAPVAAEGDPDHDLFTNMQEFIAGTDPSDASSLPEIYDAYCVGSSHVVVFFGEPGRSYSLAYSNLFTGGWITLAAPQMHGQGDYIFVTNANARNNAYRLQVNFEGLGPVQAAITNLPGMPVAMDFDGDRYPDLAVFDRAAAVWYCRLTSDNSMGVYAWGWAGACPVAGDFDGDGSTDLAAFDRSRGNWFIASRAGALLAWAVPWGFAGATPACADYDGDGADDLAVFDAASGAWFIRTLYGTVLAWQVPWGALGAVPVPGDYDGDGKADLAVYYPEAGAWYVRSVAGDLIAWAVAWGFAGAAPVPGDYDGDGRTDLGLYDPLSGNWYVRTLTGAVPAWEVNWGFAGAAAVAGDFDGDGVSDFAVYHQASGAWYIWSPTRGPMAVGEVWGWSAAVPAAPQYQINNPSP